MSHIQHLKDMKCDGCEKEATSKAAAQAWTEITIDAYGYGARKTRVQKHACSTACERKLHLELAGMEPNLTQLRAEVEAKHPDMVKEMLQVRAEMNKLRADHSVEKFALETQVATLTLANSNLASEVERGKYVSREELLDIVRAAVGHDDGLRRAAERIGAALREAGKLEAQGATQVGVADRRAPFVDVAKVEPPEPGSRLEPGADAAKCMLAFACNEAPGERDVVSMVADGLGRYIDVRHTAVSSAHIRGTVGERDKLHGAAWLFRTLADKLEALGNVLGNR